ncbi:MAG: CHAP domain-containing protein [Chitinophagales bacterium]|nr:CHAP domain-containing protein [Chitinophagales bacterium]
MKNVKWLVVVCVFLGISGWTISRFEIGMPIDRHHGVVVYYNGLKITNVSGRHMTEDGYNLGLKYQCVEFVKRYYFEYLNHRMPDTYGHAKDFYDIHLADGSFNKKRGLMQYSNGGKTQPMENDILVFGPALANKFGHVAIVSAVEDGMIEIIQQNTGLDSREKIGLLTMGDTWTVEDKYVLGWLRKED